MLAKTPAMTPKTVARFCEFMRFISALMLTCIKKKRSFLVTA